MASYVERRLQHSPGHIRVTPEHKNYKHRPDSIELYHPDFKTGFYEPSNIVRPKTPEGSDDYFPPTTDHLLGTCHELMSEI